MESYEITIKITAKRVRMAIAIIGFMGFIALLGVVGNHERTEQIIYNMSEESYEEIKTALEQRKGAEPSDGEIAEAYLKESVNSVKSDKSEQSDNSKKSEQSDNSKKSTESNTRK